MAWRHRSSTKPFRGRPAFRGKRPLGSTAKGNRITRVQRANFLLHSNLTTVPGTSFASVNVAFELAKILDHVADFTAGDGVVMASMVRSIDISSIVFDYGYIQPFSVFSVAFDPLTDRQLFLHTMLCVDRLGPGGVPDAVATVEPFETQSIVSAVGGGIPATTTLEQGWPSRVLWREHDYRNQGIITITDTSDDLYTLTNQAVYRERSGRVHKRLRLRLDDEHGLYLVASACNGTAGALDGTPIEFWAGGCIYYKVNL